MTALTPRTVEIRQDLVVGGGRLLLIAGPCQIESKEHCLMIAGRLREICDRYPVDLVFKSSYDKANRTSLQGKRGPGIEEGLRILQDVKRESGLPVLTDIHLPEEAAAAAEVADVIQTPAFLCRQTDLLVAAGATGKTVNIKKGQFLHAADMEYSARKVASHGNHKIMLCERGTCFGYRDLVVDIRNFMLMREVGYPVIFDATHSVQVMGGSAGASGGQRQFIRPLTLAAAAAGVDGLFIECHDDPGRAPSDGAAMLPLSEMEGLLKAVCAIRKAGAAL
jgi:2-dehydro-3-deoxyphosphooctonate aldolase (KDO 8-P synthase)